MNNSNVPELNNKKPVILVVDDNEVNLAVICDFLDHYNFKVILAQDSESAFEKAITNKPDLILLDVMMPGTNGFETCLRFKHENSLKDIPIIFMTALIDMDNKIKGFEAGGVDYVTKPFQNEEVLARINLHLSLRSMQKQLEIQNILLHKEISKRVKNEEALRESEKRYRQLAEISPDIILIHSRGVIKYINSVGGELFGDNPENIIGRNFLDFIHPDHRSEVIKRNIQVIREGKENKFYEEKLTRLDGREFYIETAFSPFKLYGKDAILIVGRDITNRKYAEQALKESEERFKTLVQNINGYIYSVHYYKGKVLNSYHSPQCTIITGYTPEEYIADPDLWIKMVHKDDKTWVQNFFIDLTENLHQTHIEHRIIHKDGSEKWISNIFSIRINENKEIIHNYGFILDITDRKTAEKALQEQYFFLQKLIDSIPNPIFYKNAEGIFQGCNKAYEKYLGISKEEIIGKNINELLPKEEAEFHHEMDLKLFSDPGIQVYEVQLQLPSGEDRNIIINKAVYYNADSSLGGLVGVILDITKQKITQEKLSSALDKLREMESIINKGPAVVFLWKAKEGWPVEFVSNNIIQFGFSPEDFSSDNFYYEKNNLSR